MRFVFSPATVFVVSVLVFGCAKAGSSGAQPAVQVAQLGDNPVPNAGDVAQPPVTRKIVYICRMDVVVEDMQAAQQMLNSLINSVRERGGYLAHQEQSGAGGSRRSGNWTIRVPLGQFDDLVADIEKLGDIEQNSRDAQDVTDSYTDLEARLRNKQSSEQRLLGHLEKSTNLKDTLELEREISRVRGEVEQLQGQLNLLKSKTDLATVNLTMYQRDRYIPPTQQAFIALVSQTFQDSLGHLTAFGQMIALVVVGLIPWAIAFGIPAIMGWLIQRRIRSPVANQTAGR